MVPYTNTVVYGTYHDQSHYNSISSQTEPQVRTGLNGLSVGEIAGDGFWNQRFMGRNWDISTGPTDKLNLKPEDYKLVRDALKVDVWGQVGTANDVQGISDRIQAGACAPGVFVKIR